MMATVKQPRVLLCELFSSQFQLGLGWTPDWQS